MNDILIKQVGVHITPTSSVLRDCSTYDDLGDKIDPDRSHFSLFGKIDGDAQFHILWTWAIKSATERSGMTRAATNINFCFISINLLNDVTGTGITLSHEMIHFTSGESAIKQQSHTDVRTDLMHKTHPHGIQIRKDYMEKVIR
jgi:hypothetical protein